MSIGQRLREERERLGLSQERFAAIGGVQKRAQINYEADDRAPDTSYLAGVALIGVNVQYVITGQGQPQAAPALTAEELLLLESYRSASAPVRKAALAALLSAAPTAGGMHMSNTGDGNVQIGSISGSYASPPPKVVKRTPKAN